MNYQFLPNTNIETADIIIIPIEYGESTTGNKGTKHAPKAILKATEQIEYYDEVLKWSPMKYMKVHVLKKIKFKKKRKQFNNCILGTIAAIPNKKSKLIISLGGDHSITPILTQVCMDKKGTVIFLDAHADLRSSYKGDKYSHACPVTHLLQQKHKILMIGMRSFFEKEVKIIKNTDQIDMYSDQKLQKSKNRKKLLESLSNLKGKVYLSIDMDVFDPAFVPSVGTPQPGGLDWYFIMRIFKKVFFNKNIHIVGIDIVELIPEKSTVSQIFAAKLLQKIISFWGKSNKYDRMLMVGSQTLVEYE